MDTSLRSRRAVIIAAALGLLAVSVAWAGGAFDIDGDRGSDVRAGGPPERDLEPGWALVGAAKTSIEPRPEDYGGVWETDPDRCKRLDPALLSEIVGNTTETLDHLVTAGSPWPENPNCLYMGGYGLGPMNPITSWDQEYGLWVRSVAISDGVDTLVLTIIDGEGYWWDYASKCDDCGTKAISESLGADLGIDPSGIVIAATHSHTSPDFIGGWGFVPDWYMTQVEDAIRATITDAVDNMEPAVVEVGEELARDQNRERRATYRSAEEQQLAWLRAYVPAEKPKDDDRTIATIGAYAAHPVTRDYQTGEAHADWPALFERGVEDRFGGVGLLFMTGLGNMSPAGGTAIGEELAALLPNVGEGHRLDDTDVRTTRQIWDQPATNIPLTVLGAAGFFDRQFNLRPTTLRTGQSPDTAPCISVSVYSVEVAVAAARIGDDFALTTAPGEIFSNFSNTVKETSGALVTMPIGQGMDALGYMPQDFEMNPVGQQGLGFVADGLLIVNYEDSYAIDHCYGDMALETSISLLNELG